MERRKFIGIGLIGLSISPLLYGSYNKLQKKAANVLLLGDSISIGYTPFVQKILSGKANVVRPMSANGNYENCNGTKRGIIAIDRWLGDKTWDVIHFNFGLHDLKHVDPVTGDGSVNPDHPLQSNITEYQDNLIQIIKRLKKTKAILIFATTTPYKDVKFPLRENGMAAKYNEVAINIMKRNGIYIDDLYSYILPQLNKLQKPNDVHFTKEGYSVLGEEVAKSISQFVE